ncbi:alpha/beta hydrolase-fold protein [Labrys sp. LIt4]|uniref:alpha/beta hydrolase n=1 Tax=Labrys sp. LIt4 TaxID=2821355 RepID=UPI0032AEC404
MNIRLVATIVALLCVVCGPAKAAGPSGCDLGGTQIRSMPDPVSGRSYDVEITLPSDYQVNPGKRFAVLYYADGGHLAASASCLSKEPRRQEALRLVKRLHREGKLADEPILVGLSYAKGEGFAASRARDYTPVADKPGYGGAGAFQAYLAKTVIPAIESSYRTAPRRRLFWGHSYGGLLGARILLTQADLFQSYILGSPSFWFADHTILAMEAGYARTNHDLKANVLIYVGGDEIRRYDPDRRGDTRDMVADVRTFETQLKSRGFPGLTIRSLVVPGKNHRSTIPPGFSWAITVALGGSKTTKQ